MELKSWSDEHMLGFVGVVAALLSVIVGCLIFAQDAEDCEVERRAVILAAKNEEMHRAASSEAKDWFRARFTRRVGSESS